MVTAVPFPIRQTCRTLLTTALLLCASQVSATLITSDVVSTFDSSLEGWRLSVPRGTERVFHSSSVGNPAGSAYFVDGRGGGNGMIRAPSAYHGDWSQVHELTFEHRILVLGGEPRIETQWSVDIAGPGGSARFLSDPTVVLPSVDNWVRVVVPLEESMWRPRLGFTTWEALISDVNRLDIEIEQVVNSNPLSDAANRDQAAIDNVRLSVVPVPSSLLLVAVGLALAYRRITG